MSSIPQPSTVQAPPPVAALSTAVFQPDLFKGKVLFCTGGGSGICKVITQNMVCMLSVTVQKRWIFDFALPLQTPCVTSPSTILYYLYVPLKHMHRCNWASRPPSWDETVTASSLRRRNFQTRLVKNVYQFQRTCGIQTH
jgi:hypothetical protein